MGAGLWLGRFVARPRVHVHAPCSPGMRFISLALGTCRSSTRSSGGGRDSESRGWSWSWSWSRQRSARGRRRPLLATTGVLGTARFVELAEDSSLGGDNQTHEQRMLEVSRDEINKKKNLNDDAGLSRLRDSVLFFLDLYVWEPVCTGVRFLQLAAIFVPVVLAVPMILVGPTGTLWWYGFLVKAMEWAGPAFIKLGQWAASRTDIFPNDMCEVMAKLHSHAPAHSLHATMRIVSEAFDGRSLNDIFLEFDETPLGVGAIAQVYKAKLKPRLHPVSPPGHLDVDVDVRREVGVARGVQRHVDRLLKNSPRRVPSSYVAVKVLHPGVERTVRRDLRIMYFFAAVLNAVPTMEWLSLPDEVDQFGQMMRLQLDLRIEAANLSLFRRHFHDRTTAWFPYPYAAFTTRSVLVEEFAHGMPLADFIENGGGVFQKDIASQGLDAFLRMLLLDNFVHADLHPGNIMLRFYQSDRPSLLRSEPEPAEAADPENDVTERVLARLRPHRRHKEAWEAELARMDAEGYRPQLIFIDTGLVTELSATNRRNFLDLFRAVAEFDGFKAGRLMCERCRQPDAVRDGDVFALKMQHLVLDVKSSTLALGNVKIGDILQRVLTMVRHHHVRLEGDFVNVVISILLLEGIGRQMDPDMDLLSRSLPILRQLGAQSGSDMVRAGDFSMLLVWAGLETRRFMQASIEDVSVI